MEAKIGFRFTLVSLITVSPCCDSFYRDDKRRFVSSLSSWFSFAVTETRYTLVSWRLVRRSKRERSTYRRLIRSSGCSDYYPCINARFGTDLRRVSHGIARAEMFKTYPANPSVVGEARRGLMMLSTTMRFFLRKSPYTALLLQTAECANNFIVWNYLN